MRNYTTLYKSLMAVENLANVTVEKALSHIGQLTDLSLDLRQIDGLNRAIKLSEELMGQNLTSKQSATLHYFLANARSNLRQLSRTGNQVWDWEQEEIEKEIVHLRSALKEEGFPELPKELRCSILTNLANFFDNVGRFVEAIEYWDRALGIAPSFAMAQGNRGDGLTFYARSLYDRGHAMLFLKHAHSELKKALMSELHEEAKKGFEKSRKWVESVLTGYLDKEFDMYSFNLGESDLEIRYRKWCLNNRLFLNPLNDLGPYPIGARDVFCLPSIVTKIGEGPYYHGYFNQMKQEFVSTRYLYYDGIYTTEPHFSDKDVLLFNTFDYPSYSLAVEKMKISFRTAYSLLDKIAFFLNHYLHLSIPETRVTFRTFWYESQQRNKDLRSELRQRQNWPLRGLFWLSKDLYEKESGFKESIEPDAQELLEIRNHLEHKYMKLHEGDWSGPSLNNDKIFSLLADTLAFSMYRREFEAKALKLLKMVRAALIYLSLAVHGEEGRRAGERDPNKIVPGTPLDIWEDNWKV